MIAAELPPLASVLPELILALGALALLMVGVFAGDRSARLVNALAILVLALCASVLIFGDQSGKIRIFCGASDLRQMNYEHARGKNHERYHS